MSASRELVSYGIRATLKPQTGYPLSGVVVCTLAGGRGRCYIGFSEKLVRDAGMALPQGISDTHPAYLTLTELSPVRYRLSVAYIGSLVGPVLVEYGALPVWASRVRYTHVR